MLQFSLFCISLLIQDICAHHILVTSSTASYGAWNQILHISKEILSRREDNHFITFVMPKNYDRYLNTIREFDALHSEWNLKNSYQIIYSPSVQKNDMNKINELTGFEKINTVMNLLVNSTYNSFETVMSLLTLTNYNQFKSDIYPKFELNKQKSIEYLNILNKNKYVLNENKKIDIVLTLLVAYFPIIAAQAFNIPIIERIENVMAGQLEYYNIPSSTLFYNNPFNVEGYTNVAMTYSERMQALIKNVFLFQVGMRYCAKYYLSAMIRDKYNDTLGEINNLMDVHANSAFISSMGPPVADTIYHRPRMKQFGFLLYNDSMYDSQNRKDEYSDLFAWINDKEKEDIPIILISFGSVFIFEEQTIKTMYTILKEHSRNGKYYRVLWALRQNINEKISNDEFETGYFKIRKWIPQFDILRHKNVRVFISHAGGNGGLEGTYSKKLMILMPKGGDQIYNAKRLEILEVAFIIEDRIHLSDLKAKIDLFLLPETSKYYQNNMNKLHKMLSYLGGVKEAVDFIDYIVEFGVDHLIATDKIYSLPWYQTTLIDVYFIIFVGVGIMYIVCCKCCCRKHISTEPAKQKEE